AAIDAVLTRLSKVGLGDLVMDLHDGAGSRRRIAQQLSKALAEAARVALPNMSAAQENLTRRRRELRAKSEALHEPRWPWGLSVYEIQAGLLGTPDEVTSALRLRGETLKALTTEALAELEADLESYAALGGFSPRLAASPWLAALRAGTISTPEQAARALDAATTLSSHTLPNTLTRLRVSLAEVGLTEPATLADWNMALGLLEAVQADLVRFAPEVFALPLGALAKAFEEAGGGLSRLTHWLTDPGYRQARKAFQAACREGLPSAAELAKTARALAELQTRWALAATDAGLPRLPADLDGAEGSYGQLVSELEALATFLPGEELGVLLSPSDLAARLSIYLQDRNTLFRLPELRRLEAAFERFGVEGLIEEFSSRGLSLDQQLKTLRFVWLSSILDAISVSDPHVSGFDGPAHTRSVEAFRQADIEHIATTPTRIRRAVAEHVTAARNEHPQESQVVSSEAAKKRRHLPVRQLFEASPHVLGALKPCWAMSPLVVAQVLPLQRLFDVVIFDEASQVTPADAVGALMRAERAVVAGDPHQLPPTSFFASTNDDADPDDEANAPGGALIRDLESVLDQMMALLPAPYGTRTLSWHYRSQDERLIAFSNAQPTLYDWSLTTFPGTETAPMPTHHLVPFVPGRVGEETSVAAEVAKVVELVAEHAAQRPDESLGVIAMGIKHSDRIIEELRRTRLGNPSLDDFMSESAREPFFVKNLERVQGDERDAIILTVGYGKNPEGRMLYRFGPINQEGGERRLNVAITRARQRMTVVSSFSSADMDPNRLNAEGAKMLCRYLAYAESGGTNLGPVTTEKTELNPFERDILNHLGTAGIPLVSQFGCSGYWIDFAVEHPTVPGRMVMAIEADGVSYHSSPTARDRDRLRQEHLERLGWRFHRIWSSEWFHHRETEVQRAVAAYEEAVRTYDARGGFDGPAGAAPLPTATVVEDDEALDEPITRPRLGRQPVFGGAPIDWYDHEELVRLIRWIKSDTLLRTDDQLLSEAMDALEFRRRGNKIVAALTAAIADARA
ncbi:MAG TPA: AAA domain-containing protein, partial [Acidimicrobiales bacterium]|nr:AAA domain-containing protein [Acidimicrobiales bacterium]